MNVSIVNFQPRRVEVDLVIDTAAYASGDLLSDRVAVALVSAMPAGGRTLRGRVVGVTLLDKDDEGGLLDLVFLDADVSLGTINSAPTISDTNSERVLAVVPVVSYEDLGGVKVARPSFEPIPFELSTVNLYLGAISKDTKTYTAASDLRAKLFVELSNVNS